MDLKKIFRNDRAVSPVIGVVLMVAITVILAAAIGSSVFGQSPAKSAPQANINAKLTNGAHNITIEHLGGDTIVWDSTIIRFSYENGSAVGLNNTDGIIPNPAGQFAVGEIKSFVVANSTTLPAGLPTGEVFNIKITDKVSNQLICDKKIRT
ncbi:hypothetical protein MSLAZ_0106 [Methanosarcina lacustris Z-7289]|uniref:Archaeal Type IV pilin N-terminal domain-containing protein n=1 Tax=Methanosarcina lacustris Z-7289 TaxID=1434111 RepID=A0A0E3S2T0_9EURY|nr:type IV pilin N-terminal domain-containing protein [Methanosarcina lacustris]AKB73367.1 hypothetical protein MSLAZ_0106 [Methanosarcina lacustris Z-7289]